MKRLLLLAALLIAPLSAMAQCVGSGGINTVDSCPAALSVQLGDELLMYQLAQSPHTRKATAAQILGLLSAGSGVSLATVGNSITISATGGIGTVTTTGSPASGNLTKFSGASSITSGDLSGDATTSGTLVVSIGNLSHVTNGSLANSGLANAATTVNGQTCTLGSTCAVTAGLASQAANTVVANVTASPAVPGAASLPSCTDSAGNHLNYTNGTGFSCGTSSSSSGTVISVATSGGLSGGTITTTGTISCIDAASTTKGCPTPDGTSTHYLSGAGTWTTPSGVGTVTSVTAATPNSTLSLGGTNPVTSSGTINFDLNLSHANTWAAAQTFTNSDMLLLGSSTGATTFASANAGASNFTLTFPARTAAVGTTTGTLTSGNCVKFDASGNSIDAGAPCGTGSGTVTAVSVASANGFAGSSSGGATPALTISTSVSGALKGNGTAVSQAACGDLSNGATGCSTATGTSGATIPLLNGTNVWSGQQSASVATLAISTATFTPDGSRNNYYILLVHASCPCTLANPSVTPVAGTSGQIVVQQSATGSDTIGTYGSQYEAPGGTSTITLTTAANAVDVLSYYVLDATHILVIPSLNFSH